MLGILVYICLLLYSQVNQNNYPIVTIHRISLMLLKSEGFQCNCFNGYNSFESSMGIYELFSLKIKTVTTNGSLAPKPKTKPNNKAS